MDLSGEPGWSWTMAISVRWCRLQVLTGPNHWKNVRMQVLDEAAEVAIAATGDAMAHVRVTDLVGTCRKGRLLVARAARSHAAMVAVDPGKAHVAITRAEMIARLDLLSQIR